MTSTEHPPPRLADRERRAELAELAAGAGTATADGAPLSVGVASGVRWSAADQALQQVARIVILVTIATFLDPSEVGLVGMATVFTAISGFLGDVGLGPALVHRRDLRPRHVRTAFTATVVLGVTFAVLVALASPAIASFYREPDLQPILAVLGLNFVLKGIQATPRYLMQRELRFRPLVTASSLGVLVGGAAGIGLAATGGGSWSLVLYVVGEAVVMCVVSLWFALRSGIWTPRLGLDRRSLRELFSFGAYASGYSAVYYTETHVDNLLIGRFLGPTALGYYDIAYRIMLLPIQKIADVVGNVLFPAFAAIQDDLPRVRTAFVRGVRDTALVCFPISLGVLVVAPVIVPLAFGDQWADAVPTIQILALNGPRLALSRMHGTVYQSTGRPKWAFYFELTSIVVYVAAFALSVPNGIEAVAWAFTIAGYALFPVVLWLGGRALDQPWWVVPRALARLVPPTAVMVLAVLAADHVLPDVPAVLAAGIEVAAGAAAYLAVTWIVARGVLTDAIHDVFRH
ncbi:MAG: MOP flippase family protein [Acidimicrobiales bacterium]|nr:MOP flippase family protein [Acidimicrobiales bacterium]